MVLPVAPIRRTSRRPPAWPRPSRLREALIEQNNAWQALIVGQVDLRTYTPASVVQQILHDVIGEFAKIGREGLASTAAAVETQVAMTIDKLGQDAGKHLASLVR